MASPDEKPPSEMTLEDEKSKIMYSVTMMRKLFPKKCSQFISKQLKMKHYMLETTDVVLDDYVNTEESEESMESDGEMDEVSDSSTKPVDRLSLLNRCSYLEKEMDDILAVLQQVKSEKDCDIVQICSQGLSSNLSLDAEKT